MMKLKSAILWAALSGTACTVAGCSSRPVVHDDWQESLRGALGLDCRNIEHLGYGLHYDIVLNARQATTPEAAGVPVRLPGRGGQRGD